VVDASALAKYLLREEGWELVEGYLVKGVVSVDHVVKEVANAIWKHVAVRRVIPRELGIELLKALKKLVEERVVVLESEGLYIEKGFEIAISYGVTLYDALYVAQALKHGELLTSDEKQAEVAKALGIKVHFVA